MTSLFTKGAIMNNPKLSFFKDDKLTPSEQMNKLFNLFIDNKEKTEHMIFFLVFLMFIDEEEPNAEDKDILNEISGMIKQKQIKIENISLDSIIHFKFGPLKMKEFSEWIERRK